MKIISKWIITLILLGSLFYLAFERDFDLEQFSKWEVAAVIIVAVVVWLGFRWRKAMRLKDTPVRIQLLDD